VSKDGLAGANTETSRAGFGLGAKFRAEVVEQVRQVKNEFAADDHSDSRLELHTR